MRHFRPDVPHIIKKKGSGLDEDEDQFDDDAAFEPLADSMAEIVSDSIRRREKPSKPSLSVTEHYDVKPFVVDGYGEWVTAYSPIE
jgi:hypothetical protein